MDQAQQDELLDQINDALLKDDMETVMRLAKILPMPPEAADSLRIGFGAEVLKGWGFNLSEANKEFGPNWLDE